MMGGEGDQRGIIPRLCEAIFETIDKNEDPNKSFKVEVRIFFESKKKKKKKTNS